MARLSKSEPLPHSWPLNDWPSGVYPNRASSGRYLVRTHRDALIACGALTRIGRELVVLGEGYARFLARHADRAAEWPLAANARGGTARDEAA
jgi:hypothetical protein